jgi:hypothetical protein
VCHWLRQCLARTKIAPDTIVKLCLIYDGDFTVYLMVVQALAAPVAHISFGALLAPPWRPTLVICGFALVFKNDADSLARKLLSQDIHVFATIEADKVIRIIRIVRFLVTMHGKNFEVSHAFE